MKLTTFFMLAAAVHVSAAGFGQTVTYSAKEVPLTKVLSAIQQQTGLNVFYDEADLKSTRPVTVDFKSTPFVQVLQTLLPEQGLKYQIEGNTISISKAPATVSSQIPLNPPGDIHGRVTDSLGNPLAGASVTVKGSNKGVTTDGGGQFILKGVADDAVIVISFTGFDSREIPLGSRTFVNIRLFHSDNVLDQVQIIAYGTTTRRLTVGNVSTVNSSEIEKQPVTNVLQALEGRVPGLFITQANGIPGGGINVQIQGQNSIHSGNDPFYVVDGVPYIQELLPNLSSGILGVSSPNTQYPSQGGNPLSYINPLDIESISVLKDADATAIYGSRAANGAIIITTKKGKVGQMKTEFNLQQGFGQVTRTLDVLNLQQYLAMRHEAFQNDGKPFPSLSSNPTNTDWDINGLWDTTRSTNWQRTLIGNTAQFTNLTSSVSGGTTSTQYLVSATYNRQTTVFPGSFDDKKGAFHFNLSSMSSNGKLKMQFLANYLIDNNRLPAVDLTAAAITLAPDAPVLYNANGSLNWQPNSAGSSTWTNPLANTMASYSNQTNNLGTNLRLSYSVISGLDVHANFGYSYMQITENNIHPLTYFAPETRPLLGGAGFATYGNNNQNSWIIEPQINFRKSFERNNLNLLLGGTVQQNTGAVQEFNGSGYSSAALLQNPSSAATITTSASYYIQYKYAAAFGRLNYNWDEKYLVALTVRRDGSSRFGPANEFHNFGSAGIGWIFSKEHLIEKNLPVLSFGKISATYGITGNDQIKDYQFFPQYNSVSAPVPYQGVSALKPSALSNPSLQWESTKKVDAGIDLGFFKDRLLLGAHYFNNRSSNELLAYNLSIVTGFSSITSNFPATVQNTGWELTAFSLNLRNGDFRWSTNLNITLPQNKLVSFPNLASSSYAKLLVIGEPLQIRKLLPFAGVNSSTGLYQYYGQKGVTSSPNLSTDLTAVVNLSPRYYGGLGNTFSYKNVSLDFLFQFTKQLGGNDYYGITANGPAGSFQGGNQPLSILGRWQVPGDNAPVQMFTTLNPSLPAIYLQSSNAVFSDASYIRLKNLSLSWQLCNSWLKKAHLQSFRIYVQGQNLVTFTKYHGLDPENTSVSALPPLRMVVGGVQIGL